jgi:hypothetical protein
MTSSRIEFSSVLAPSANRATSSNVDPVVVVVVVTVVSAAVEDDEDAAALDAFALDLLNAARAYSTASKLPETAFAPAFVLVVVDDDVCAPDPRNNCLNVSLALSVVVVVDPSASSLPLPCCKSNVADADADVAVVPLRNGSSSGCASATRLSCSIISAESRRVASRAE